jgi:ribosomal protein S18 acetylase RimI-like enzyme
VAVDQVTGACVGYITARMRRFSLAVDPLAPALADGCAEREGELHIVDIAVSPDCKGRALERLLLGQALDSCVQRYPKCRSALLFVRRSDAVTRKIAATRRFLVVDCLSEFRGESVCVLAMRRFFEPTVR